MSTQTCCVGDLSGLFPSCSLETLLGTSSWEPCLRTCSWEPLPGNLAWEPFPGNAWGNLLGTSWEPLGNLLETSWEPLGNLAWEPLGNLAWEPCLGTSWEPLGNLAWEPVPGNLGTLAWDSLGKGGPFLGTWFPTLRGADLAAPTCSGAFTMAEDHQLTLLGKKQLSLIFQSY